MSKSKIIEHEGVYIDLAKVRCLKYEPNPFLHEPRKYILEIELCARVQYIWHLGTKEWEKETLTDIVEVEFSNHVTAQERVKEWAKLWQDYLDMDDHI